MAAGPPEALAPAGRLARDLPGCAVECTIFSPVRSADHPRI